jgi:mannosyltransferase OCH1-like enzyme
MIHFFKDGDPGYSYESSWEKCVGNMEWMEWNSSNLPYKEYPILEKYADKKEWSILSDFVRRWAILKYGGVYLDLDIELIKPIDHVFNFESFVCIEGPPAFANMAVSGGKKGNNHHKVMLDMYLDVISGNRNYSVPIQAACGPWVTTDYVVSLKGKPLDDVDMYIMNDFDGLVTLPKSCFFPFNWNEKYDVSCIKDNTYGIHWWKKGWS